ncbi:MAG: hypothetical protein CM15mP59_3450 [Flavobacteriaceae bacterium]|nr:MAG: hypothetical protein CM15mP59_3450 [Flavobacteriaceae bacterium]
MEFESFNEGYLLHIGIAEGESAAVDSLLAIIGDEGEDISGLLNGSQRQLLQKKPKSRRIQPEEFTNSQQQPYQKVLRLSKCLV